MPTHKEKEDSNALVIHYLAFRQLLGFMGISLPVLLIIGSFIFDGGHIETSISNFYYTCLRDVFVVILCAVALFLFAYQGYDKADKWVTNIAGIFGVTVAFVSTNFKYDITLPCYKLLSQRTDSIGQLLPLKENCICESYTIIPYPHAEYIGYIHLTCAALFFLALAYMSYFQFTKTAGNPSPQKLKRNILYKTCAIIMAACILGLVPCFVSNSLKLFYDSHKLVFWGESISLWAFGASWLVKGEFIWKDKLPS